ncbi:MAG: hypothetical protein KUG77_12935 [Nannocystaceae bacterium]|nr:hypothetical protein [Nannocystaceae bacterium]
MALNSRQTYRLLKEAAQPWLKRSGTRAKDGRWVCQRTEGQELLLLFQCGGAHSAVGWGEFTVNFQLFDEARERQVLGCRVGDLMEAEDEPVWVELSNRVISKIRGAPQRPLEDWETPEMRASDFEFKDSCAGSDPWLRFFDEDDVRSWWLEFLEPRVDAMLARFLELGGAEPTPDYPRVDIPSLAVTVDDQGYSVFRMVQREAITLAQGLSKVLSDKWPGVLARHGGTLFVFDALGRTGVVEDDLLGTHRNRRVWTRFGAVALEQLIESLRRPSNDGPITLGKSARIRLQVDVSVSLVQ